MNQPAEANGKTDGGHSGRYCGERGAAYYAFQSARAKVTAQRNLRRFQPLIAPTDDLLEFGCGGGELLSLLSAGSKVGVDINETALADARRKGLEVYPSLDAIPAGLRFDVVLSNHCLEHVPYPIGALRALRERLRPGGRLILCVPIDDWRIQRRYDPLDINHHLHTWTPLLLGHTLTEAGFEVGPMRILTATWPRRLARFERFLPQRLWDSLSFLAGVIRKQRSILAIARRLSDAPTHHMP
ncbi:MAG: class I SAM-dependent methyltransferase [Candidatus Sumerlaeia bacterium]|nr:class I SAM-dependent methyltransferase [Candidatus Sumerlaeia bacterium]